MQKTTPDWRKVLSLSITNPQQIGKKFEINLPELDEVVQKYPMRINPYYFSLIKSKDDPLWRQSVPDKEELLDSKGIEDPLYEESQSPVPGLVHRYPDRALLLISNICAMYCRFCTRKRKVGKEYETITPEKFNNALNYIKEHKEIRDIILSGGDPLLLPDDQLEYFIKEVRDIPSVEIIRIGTRAPCTLPQRVTEELCDMLKKYHPIYVNTHFNHPNEITEESEKACNMLADAGIPLGNQSVLLEGVNDDPQVMKNLVQKLLQIRVKPYYIYIADDVKGTYHFKTSLKKGIEIIEALRGWTSGMAVPQLIVDIQGGGGKIPILPEYLQKVEGKNCFFRNYKNKEFVYEDV